MHLEKSKRIVIIEFEKLFLIKLSKISLFNKNCFVNKVVSKNNF